MGHLEIYDDNRINILYSYLRSRLTEFTIPCHRGKPLEKKLLFSRKAIQERVKELAVRISIDYGEQEPVLIGILNGAVYFFADLTREISVPIKIDFIRAASYGSEMVSCGDIRLTKDLEIPVKGRPVILVEDIVDTGLTLTHIIKKLETKGPESIKVCALIDKLERRDVSVPVDYCGFQIKDGFVVGYGLDHNEKYRQLPDIYVLD